MLNRTHVKINYQRLADVFQLGSDRYQKLGGMLGKIMNRNNRDNGQTRRMAFRIADDINRNPPVHNLRNDPGWSERVEVTIRPNRVTPGVSFDVQILGRTRMVTSSQMHESHGDGKSKSPFIGIRFTRNGDARTATINGLTLQGKELPVTKENFEKMMTLAGLTAAQILSGSPTNFAGNLQRVYGANRNRRHLRHLMTTGRPKPKGPA